MEQPHLFNPFKPFEAQIDFSDTYSLYAAVQFTFLFLE